MAEQTAELINDDMTGYAATSAQDEPVIDELLVEEVSIDGMCGVY